MRASVVLSSGSMSNSINSNTTKPESFHKKKTASGGAAVVLTPSEVEMVVYSGLGSVAHFNHRNEQDILS